MPGFSSRTPKIPGYYYYNGPIMEWKNKNLTMSAANTFTTEQIDCPVHSAVNLSMLLHEAEFNWTPLDVVADGDSVNLSLLSKDSASTPVLSDPEVITQLTGEFKLVTSGMSWIEAPVRKLWSKPQLYGKSKMYFGMQTTGQAGAEGGYVRVGYTLCQVSVYRMVDALVQE